MERKVHCYEIIMEAKEIEHERRLQNVELSLEIMETWYEKPTFWRRVEKLQEKFHQKIDLRIQTEEIVMEKDDESHGSKEMLEK